MQYFLFITFLSFFVHFQNAYNKNKNINLLIFYFFVFFVALALGLRGNDDEYTRVFLSYPDLNNLFSEDNLRLHEKGFIFALILASIKSLELSSQYLFIFFCFTSIFLNAVFIKKFTDFYFLAFLFYLSHGIIFKEWSGLRAGLASAMVFPMIYYLHEEKKIKFFTLVVTATLIQYIAIFSLFLIFLKRSFSRILLLLGIFFAMIFYKLNLAVFITEILLNNNFIPSFASGYFVKDNHYMYDVGLTHIKMIQQLIVIVFLIIFFGSNKVQVPKYYYLLFNTYYLGT